MNRKQANAIMRKVIKNSALSNVLEGVLGDDEVPRMEDFKSRDQGVRKKCTTFLDTMRDAVQIVRTDMNSRGLQPEMFDPETGQPQVGSDPKKKSKSKKKRSKDATSAERANKKSKKKAGASKKKTSKGAK